MVTDYIYAPNVTKTEWKIAANAVVPDWKECILKDVGIALKTQKFLNFFAEEFPMVFRLPGFVFL